MGHLLRPGVRPGVRPDLCTGLLLVLLLALAGRASADPDRPHHTHAAHAAHAAHADHADDLDAGCAWVDESEAAGELETALRPGAPIVAPPIGEVLAVAYAAAGLDHDPGHSFMRRARLAGLVPLVSVRTGRNARWRDDEPDIGRGATIEVRATWRLDRLVFEPRELQVVALVAARRRERRHLATHVIRTYFTWRTAMAAGRGARSTSRADTAAAELDALTDAWFSEAVDGLRRTASEPRTVRVGAAAP